MTGKVFLNKDFDKELNKIQELCKGYSRKFYIHGYSTDVSFFSNSLQDFVFIDLKDLLKPQNINVVTDNNEKDFFVLKKLRFNDILDRSVEVLQSLKGFKLVVDDHPYMGKGDMSWSYFLWSFFDRSLLGYPHIYAFQTALKKSMPALDELALKVSSKSDTTLKTIYEEDIITEKIELTSEVKKEYSALKTELFKKYNSALLIIRELRMFLKNKNSQMNRGFDLLKFSRIHEQYLKGCKVLVISDAKVDVYLEKKFWEYIKGVNLFVSTLWNTHN